MADTLSLDTAVAFIIGRGGSVRLVGDDQQLAAIGAGGVLRDIASHLGAVRLTELHRFTDPAEAAATLALRDGRSEALGFYLDRQRVHVGDPTTTLDAVFNAWQADRSRGLDAIMLAPTRDRSAGLTDAPATTAWPTQPWPAGRLGRRQPGQCRRPDHHPQQRPQAPYQRDRLGEKRRPVDHPQPDQYRWVEGAARPERPDPHPARRLRLHGYRIGIRHHCAHRARCHRRHHARRRHR